MVQARNDDDDADDDEYMSKRQPSETAEARLLTGHASFLMQNDSVQARSTDN